MFDSKLILLLVLSITILFLHKNLLKTRTDVKLLKFKINNIEEEEEKRKLKMIENKKKELEKINSLLEKQNNEEEKKVIVATKKTVDKEEQEFSNSFIKENDFDFCSGEKEVDNTESYNATDSDSDSELEFDKESSTTPVIIEYSNCEKSITSINDNLMPNLNLKSFEILTEFSDEEFNSDLNDSDLKKFKLLELQELAQKYNITITKDINGKYKNRTKKELINDIKLAQIDN